MKRLLIVLALAGCVEDSYMPSPAIQQVMASCNAGDTGACKSVADIEQRERERISAIPPIKFDRLDPAPFMRPLQQRCIYTGMGQTVYQNCY